MKICEIEINDDRELIDIIRSPVAKLNIGFPLSYEIKKRRFTELDKVLLTENYLLLTQLASLYFYDCNLDFCENISSNFVLPMTRFEKVKELVFLLFEHVVISELYSSLCEEKLIYICVRKITPEGEAILNQLISENKIPNELSELYINKKNCDDAVGLYKITGYDHNIEESEFLCEFCKDKYNNSLDISSLSLSECSRNKICNYIAGKKKNVYIYVSGVYGSDFKIKHLIWH